MKKRLSKISTLKKALCLILVFAALLVSLSACGGDDEKKLVGASCAEGGYTFDHEEGWKTTFNGGETTLSTMTVGGQLPEVVVSFTVFENTGFDSAKSYWEDGAENFATMYEGYKALSRESFSSVDGGFKDGYIAKMTVETSAAMGIYGQAKSEDEKVAYNITQLVFNNGDRLCCATYICTVEKNPDHESTVDSVKNSFAFTEPEKSEVADKGYTDFSLTAPEGWTLTESEAYLVYKKGNATVVANAYSLNYSKASTLYWRDDYQPGLEKGLKGFKVVSLDEEARLGLLAAVDCVYTGISASGAEYTFRTILAVSVSEVYLLTLTASPQDYEGCVEDFLSMAEGFTVK